MSDSFSRTLADAEAGLPELRQVPASELAQRVAARVRVRHRRRIAAVLLFAAAVPFTAFLLNSAPEHPKPEGVDSPQLVAEASERMASGLRAINASLAHDPQHLRQIEVETHEWMAHRWQRRALRAKNAGRWDEARRNYERIVDQLPATEPAESARIELAALPPPNERDH